MANSTINITVDVLDVDVMLEIEVIWHMSVHKIIETTQLLEEEYTDLIDLNCDESTY